jgi:molybdopterin synthase sulfur carrier subunit
VTIKIKLFATFRKDRFKQKDIELPDNATLSEVMKPLCLPESQAKIVMVNGISTVEDCPLHDNDVIAIFPRIAGG